MAGDYRSDDSDKGFFSTFKQGKNYALVAEIVLYLFHAVIYLETFSRWEFYFEERYPSIAGNLHVIQISQDCSPVVNAAG